MLLAFCAAAALAWSFWIGHSVQTHISSPRPAITADRTPSSSSIVTKAPPITLTQEAPEVDAIAHERPPLPITAQERDALLRHVYGELLWDLDLSDAELGAFYELVFAAMQLRWRQSTASATTPTDADDEVKRINDELLMLLGTERFARYEAFESTIRPRSVVRNFANELHWTGAAPLTDQQRQQLLTMIVEELSLLPPSVGAPAVEELKMPGNLQDRVLERAQFILTAEQLAVFRVRLSY
jgi:hypothetical protein